MTGSRFEHALGAMHLAGLAWDRLWANSQSHWDDLLEQVRHDMEDAQVTGDVVDPYSLQAVGSTDPAHALRLALQAVALTHDIGHPPFSHALENFYIRHLVEITEQTWVDSSWRSITQRAGGSDLPMHEIAGHLVFNQFSEWVSGTLPWWLARAILMERFGWAKALHQLVASPIDVDRLDYLLRDANGSGTEFGALDSQRLLDSLELHFDGSEWVLGFGIRATSAIESFFFNRLQYYRWVVFHPHTIAENRMLARAVETAMVIRKSGMRSDAGSSYADLNYFAALPGSSPELLADVDDGMVRELLKLTRRKVDAVEPRQRTTYEQEFNALSLAVTRRRSNWSPVWKTSRDYAAIAQILVPRLIYSLGELVDEAVKEGYTDQHLGSGAASDVLTILRARQAIKRLERDFTAPTLALNRLMSGLLQSTSMMPRDAREDLLAQRLTSVAEFDGLSGIWLVGYEPVSVTGSADAGIHASGEQVYRANVAVFENDDRLDASEVTTMFDSLTLLARSTPAFYAYFLATDGQNDSRGPLR